jgi:hypothetical protein
MFVPERYIKLMGIQSSWWPERRLLKCVPIVGWLELIALAFPNTILPEHDQADDFENHRRRHMAIRFSRPGLLASTGLGSRRAGSRPGASRAWQFLLRSMARDPRALAPNTASLQMTDADRMPQPRQDGWSFSLPEPFYPALHRPPRKLILLTKSDPRGPDAR